MAAPAEPTHITGASFREALDGRHSIYALKPTSSVPDEKLKGILEDAVLHVPSSFNSQTSRLVLIVKEEHKKFWEMVMQVNRDKLIAQGESEKWERTKPRIQGFLDAYGSVFFLENNDKVAEMEKNFAMYAWLFPLWSEQTSGMHQFVVWSALEAEGLGASLQHYHFDKDVEEKAKEMYDLPKNWSMKAQLVFGDRQSQDPVKNKEKLPTSETVRIFGF